MSRKEFLSFLARSVKDGLVTEDEAGQLLAKYDRGEINDNDYPLSLQEGIAEVDDEDVKKSLAALLLLGLIFTVTGRRIKDTDTLLSLPHIDRAKLRESLQDHFIARSAQLTEAYSKNKIVVTWQEGFRDLVKDNLIQQASIGKGAALATEETSVLSEAVKVQTAYASGFADEVAVRAMLDNPYSLEAMAARSVLYAGAGRAEWYQHDLLETDDGYVVDFVAANDAATCEPCSDADSGSPYLADDPDLPMPGAVCDGFGNCRCELVVRYDREAWEQMAGRVLEAA